MMSKKLISLKADQEGSVVVEFALYGIILSVMVIGVIDFGLAYAREMSMANAVRAGTQLALARHPSIGPSAEQSDALISVRQIRDAVVQATPFLAGDPGSNQLMVDVLCGCNDGSQVACASLQTTPGSCLVDAVFVEVRLSLPYDLTLGFPGVGDQLTLSTEHTVRIN